jgi:hypothetical protein
MECCVSGVMILGSCLAASGWLRRAVGVAVVSEVRWYRRRGGQVAIALAASVAAGVSLTNYACEARLLTHQAHLRAPPLQDICSSNPGPKAAFRAALADSSSYLVK